MAMNTGPFEEKKNISYETVKKKVLRKILGSIIENGMWRSRVNR